jgi:hypothetical protein
MRPIIVAGGFDRETAAEDLRPSIWHPQGAHPAIATLDLCVLPDLLVRVEGYRDRLAALTLPTSSDPAQEP